MTGGSDRGHAIVSTPAPSCRLTGCVAVRPLTERQGNCWANVVLHGRARARSSAQRSSPNAA